SLHGHQAAVPHLRGSHHLRDGRPGQRDPLGAGGHHLSEEGPPRAAREEHQQELTSEAAFHRVRQNDRERASNVKFLYHVDWDDPLHYDLVLNTERMDVKEGARVLRNALENERVRPTPESRAEVKDLSLVAQAKAALLAHPATRGLHLSLACKQGQLSVSGMVEGEVMRKAAEEILGQIAGGTAVRSDLFVLATGRTPVRV